MQIVQITAAPVNENQNWKEATSIINIATDPLSCWTDSRKHKNLFQFSNTEVAHAVKMDGKNLPDFRFTPSRWETPLLYNDVSPWLGANLESTWRTYLSHTRVLSMMCLTPKYLKCSCLSMAVCIKSLCISCTIVLLCKAFPFFAHEWGLDILIQFKGQLYILVFLWHGDIMRCCADIQADTQFIHYNLSKIWDGRYHADINARKPQQCYL